MHFMILSWFHYTFIGYKFYYSHPIPWDPDKKSLGGGFKPFEKYERQIGSFPQVGVKIEKKKKPII